MLHNCRAPQLQDSNTYKLQDGENPTGRVKQRHFNEIEPAPQQILSWETEESGDSIDNWTTSSDSEWEPTSFPGPFGGREKALAPAGF